MWYINASEIASRRNAVPEDAAFSTSAAEAAFQGETDANKIPVRYCEKYVTIGGDKVLERRDE
jgi:hypothetical protein